MRYEVDFTFAPAGTAGDPLPELSPEQIATHLRHGLRVFLSRVVATASSLAPSDVGVLAGSLTYDVYGDGLDMYGMAGTDLAYGMAVEFGRRKGAPPPPMGALLGWMSRHGWEVTEEAEERLRWSIAAKGTIAQPFLIPAFDTHLPEAADLIASYLFGDAAAGRGLVRADGRLIQET